MRLVLSWMSCCCIAEIRTGIFEKSSYCIFCFSLTLEKKVHVLMKILTKDSINFKSFCFMSAPKTPKKCCKTRIQIDFVSSFVPFNNLQNSSSVSIRASSWFIQYSISEKGLPKAWMVLLKIQTDS